MLSFVVIFGVTLAFFLLVIAGMAVGVLMGRREISGSCGGLANQGAEGGEASCSLCSNPDAACRELKERMAGQSANADACDESDPCGGENNCTPAKAHCSES